MAASEAANGKSRVIEAGNNDAALPNFMIDFDGNPRFVYDLVAPNFPAAPCTCGIPPIVDIRAYGFDPSPCGLADLDGDVDLYDCNMLNASDQVACSSFATPDLNANGQAALDEYFFSSIR